MRSNLFNKMHSSVLVLGFVAIASAWPKPPTPACKDIEIPITVSAPRFIINATVEDNWDAAALTLNLTRRDSGMTADPLPIAGATSTAEESTYTIGATLCGTGGPMLVLTHGIIESKLCVAKTLVSQSGKAGLIEVA